MTLPVPMDFMPALSPVMIFRKFVFVTSLQNERKHYMNIDDSLMSNLNKYC